MPRRISYLFLPVVLFFAHVNGVFAANKSDSTAVEAVRDFAQLAPTLERERLPLLLMFSSDFCHYCERVEREFLIPMQISGDYEERVVIRKMKIDYGSQVVDFDGRRVDADEFAARYNVSVTPTVVFLDAQGQQLAPKRVGLMTPDFYGGYLDESIATALDILRRTKPLRVKLSSNE